MGEGGGIQHEPIAIVGMGCRLPGQVSSPSDLWHLLIQNKSGHCAVPKMRYNAEGFYHPNADRPGSINSTGGYFLQEDPRLFENAFFGINNLEASSMNAQQRKLLEVVYESFESGGVPLAKVRGSKTGVYVGNFTNDHMIMQYKDPEYFSRYSATGSGPTILSNRITHCFDLRGPSVVLDTACSSSIYALHFACLALDARDCDAAVVASANLIQTPEQQLIAVKAGILSPDSTCHTFDESANGYGRADGVSALYLKRLSDALRDGDPIRSVIRGTAVNGNGCTPGIVQPSVDGQEAVIRAAYRRAQIHPDETDYVEAHGTGTQVGDPIELEAISRVFCHKTGTPTAVGGIKPNIGHSEGASGLSSIIKLALALEQRQIPATIGIKNTNPNIKLKEWNLDIVKENRSWPSSRIVRVSVNSFGFGGANGHAILETPSLHSIRSKAIPGGSIFANYDASGNTSTNAPPPPGPFLLTFSARTEYSCITLLESVSNYISRPGNRVCMRDLVYTLNGRRSRFGTRGFVIATSQNLVADLRPENMIKRAPETETEALPLVFVFTGQGAQWPGMGKELFHHYSKFRESIRYLDTCLATLSVEDKPSWTLEETLLAPRENSDINQAEKSQPICTAIQIALVAVLKEWNITPKVAIGHSSGEIGAAYVSGHLTAYQAIMAAYFRGRTVARHAQDGAMLAVGLGKEAAWTLVTENDLTGQISLACDNSPESTTLSGDGCAIDKLFDVLQQKQIFVRKLRTGGQAYHSKHMKKLGYIYQESLQRVWHAGPRPRCKNSPSRDTNYRSADSNVLVISSVTGAESTSGDMSTPEYWRANLESPVRFFDAVKGVFGMGRHHLLELGPHSALKLPIKQIASFENRDPVYYRYDSALVSGKDAAVTLLALVGSLFLQGHDDLPWEDVGPDDLALRAPDRRVLTDLPSYPWDYTAPVLWTEPRATTEFRNRSAPRHDLLGSRIPGGSKLTMTWRNIIDVHEVDWLKDHCLGPSVVFPAAAYVAMVVEAACQANGVKLWDCKGVEIHQFNFLNAMSFDVERLPKLEVITELRKAYITSIVASEDWWQFAVSSISGENSLSTTHATGRVRLTKISQNIPRTINLDRLTMEKQATRVWYDKFTKEGLNWGPKFAVMEDIFCDRARQANIATALMKLQRGDRIGRKQSWQYIAHPISIDSMLQTAFVATTGGWVRKLRATVPVEIDRIFFSAPGLLDMGLEKKWAVDAKSTRVGFGTVNIEAELYNTSHQTLIRMEGVRCIAYQGNAQRNAEVQRNPMCRVVWRPDITFMEAGSSRGLTKYTDWFAQKFPREKSPLVPEIWIRVAGALDLCLHRTPNARVLLLSEREDARRPFLGVLRAGSPLRRFDTFTQATFTNGNLSGIENSSTELENEITDEPILADTKFDLVIALEALPNGIEDRLATPATIITADRVDESAFSAYSIKTITETINTNVRIVIIRAKLPVEAKQRRTVVMVNRTGKESALDSKIKNAMASYFGHSVPLIGLSNADEITIPIKSVVISTIESNEPMLSTLTEEQMCLVKKMTDRASFILWVCNADFVGGTKPEFAPVLGLSRAVMLEQPSLRFAVFDVGDMSKNVDGTAYNAIKILDQLLTTTDPEFELCQREEIVHSIRWDPLDDLNREFRLKLDEELLKMPVSNAGYCHLGISQPGKMDTLHFIAEEHVEPLSEGYVEINVKSVGMNAKDLYAINAKVDTRNVSCSCECAGFIAKVGSKVMGLKLGDRVVAMAPGLFATHERVPQWAVCKLEDNEDFTTASTIPIVFSTAIYGLIYKANLQRGESVLIHSAAGGVGIASIQLAKHIGAEIFATVGNESKKEWLVGEFGLDPSRIFTSRDTSFLPAVMNATGSKGVDVVLNSLTGELLRSSFEACANFGRFVEIGKRDILDHGSLDMSNFQKNISFMAFDLSNLFYSQKPEHHELWQDLLRQSLALIRDGVAKPCFPIRTFPASDITRAFRHFALGTRIGKVTVSFADDTDQILVKPRRFTTIFHPDKTYLLVGCLGGLGRSISKWMVSRGARSLVFFGRSGLKSQEAKMLVSDLLGQGADVKVVSGDVSKLSDVDKAILHAPFPIGGVIHAAMGLSESLWSSMSHASWHTSIAPKVRGSWNLHNALEKDDRGSKLDFFILTSSISGTVGTATESNYCAANAFLDAFARHRNRLGRPAVSIGYGMIAEVGYLHEHPDIEALLKRKGIHSITEDEMLQILDLAVAHQSPATWRPEYDRLVGAHILTGIEFTGLKEQRNRGFEGDNHVLADPRASLLAAAFERSTRGSDSEPIRASYSLPPEVAEALVSGLVSGRSTTSVFDAVQTIVARKISNLILLPVESLRPEQKLGEFGIDSMLAAEFRVSIFHALDVDVPFMTLLDKQTSVRSLTEMIMTELGSKA
ncbi:hypothetical protein E0Z10_g3506 [Xylaria hypoxylon]|uniref:Uncharacterized protein n=1 Tax=Xylaria hypoxylon TaxID=37992 RepID=A0A4Z0Z1M6_9PEZI|nr:hypothetical protein E0Z10_g3506 [Xylaria hypoxylon]